MDMVKYVLVLLLVNIIDGGFLQFILYQQKYECFYNDKVKGDRVEATFELGNPNEKINFVVFDPENNILEKHKSKSEANVLLTANHTGAYKFCFGGRKLVSSVPVFFSFDLEIEDDVKIEAEKKFSQQKVVFLNHVLETVKLNDDLKKGKFNLTEQFLLKIVRNSKNKLVETLRPDDSLEGAIMYMSILADRMENYLDTHKIKSRQHFRLQESNANMVNVYSLVIFLSILLSVVIQLIVVKSFFTGSKSLKWWQY